MTLISINVFYLWHLLLLVSLKTPAVTTVSFSKFQFMRLCSDSDSMKHVALNFPCSTHTSSDKQAPTQKIWLFLLCFSVRNRLREIVGASTNWRYWTIRVKAPRKHNNICAVLFHLFFAGRQDLLLLCLMTSTKYRCINIFALLHLFDFLHMISWYDMMQYYTTNLPST